MNTSALKRFAQQARNILKSGVEKQLISWGYNHKTKQFILEPQQVFGGMLFGEKMIDDPTVYSKWMALKKAIHTKGVDQVVEEAAYTWFNRLIAIQILAKNNYIAPQLQYASAATRSTLLVQNAKRGNTPQMDALQQKQLDRLLDDDRLETELFTLLITAYCHQSDLLQRVFGRIDDYTELLLPADILATNGFIDLLNTSDAMTDDDYQHVELIGWLYQFYISEKKDEVFKSFKNKKKAEAEDIPAATQIFTPNWIVKYMVQNTVGRLWLDLHPDSRLRDQMNYLVSNPESESSTTNSPLISEVAQLKLLDPASGSGHILVEGFDLLYAMYREEGYPASEAVRSIFENNLFGLDIDPRAAQLATFALLLKAAAQDRSILASNLLPHLYAMPEKEVFTPQEIHDFLGKAYAMHADALYNALELMQQSQNLGSIMKFNFSDEARCAIIQQTAAWQTLQPTDLLQQELWKRLAPYLQVLQVLTEKYEAVAANPPYMGSSNMNDTLKDYINSNYPNGKADLMTVFMEQIASQTKDQGIFSMINLPSWLFLSSFDKLRKYFIDNYYFQSLIHFGRGIFGIDFGSVAFTLKKEKALARKGNYFRLHERNFQHIYYADIERLFLFSNGNPTYKYDFSQYRDDDGVSIIPEQGSENGLKLYYPNISQSNFEKIPGSPIAYWVSKKVADFFKNNPILDKFGDCKQGLSTADNNKFVRFWQEINYESFSHNKDAFLSKWFPFNKGGSKRKWYGNQEFVINWQNNGSELRNFRGAAVRNTEYYFKECISWGLIASGGASFRYYPNGFIFDAAGSSYFPTKSIYNALGILNTEFYFQLANILNPTLNLSNGVVSVLPYAEINDLLFISTVKHNITISKSDWDSRETSWDFEKHPLINAEQTALESAYQAWEERVTQDFYQLHANETELNRIFIDIYGLQDELTPEVKLKDITILQEELDSRALGDATEPIGKLPIKQEVVMRQLISYLVGCIMGRYRLDKPGLHIAHPKPTEEETAAYSYHGHPIEIDDDAIIPLMDNTSSFADNALIRIKNLLEVQWGDDKQMIDTINYLQGALGKDLESYLVKDFWKDHCSRYQKRPIYWLFASPKGAFQVITYMHRMNKYTVEKIRSNYLLTHISNLDNRIRTYQGMGNGLTQAQTRELTILQRDLQECRDYDLLLKDVADHQIDFDLDDGVAVNYAKFASVVAPIK